MKNISTPPIKPVYYIQGRCCMSQQTSLISQQSQIPPTSGLGNLTRFEFGPEKQVMQSETERELRNNSDLFVCFSTKCWKFSCVVFFLTIIFNVINVKITPNNQDTWWSSRSPLRGPQGWYLPHWGRSSRSCWWTLVSCLPPNISDEDILDDIDDDGDGNGDGKDDLTIKT